MHHSHEDVIAGSKTVTLTLCIERKIKVTLQRAVELEHRSIANMVEVQISEHCRVKGIATGASYNNKRAAKGATS